MVVLFGKFPQNDLEEEGQMPRKSMPRADLSPAPHLNPGLEQDIASGALYARLKPK
jgi:hypothetical protein